MISQTNLDFWIENRYNVLLSGKHGVGKTATILEAFKKHGLKWQYFSASTMDPWVDFIGVPKERTDEKGNVYLDLVRPKHFQNDEVEAIFLDEFNRSSKKVRNAVMELIQFKSINGKRFENLKIVWAAINPEDDEQNKYDVEPLDPAQIDRFHFLVEIPYMPYLPYFKNKYGINGEIAVNWWKQLQQEQKNKISPRRLDYTMDVYQKGGNIKMVLPKEANTHKLIQELSFGPISKQLQELFIAQKDHETKQWLAIENNYNASVLEIIKKDSFIKYFVPLMSPEKVSSLVVKHVNIENFVFNNSGLFKQLISDLQNSGNKKLRDRALKFIDNENDVIKVDFSLMNFSHAREKTFNKYRIGGINSQDAQLALVELCYIAYHSHSTTLKRKFFDLDNLMEKAIKLGANINKVPKHVIQGISWRYGHILNSNQHVDTVDEAII